MENSNTNKGGMGFCSVLTLIFIVLKLCGVIKWSWIWVLAPMWIGLALGIIVVLIGIMLVHIGH